MKVSVCVCVCVQVTEAVRYSESEVCGGAAEVKPGQGSVSVWNGTNPADWAEWGGGEEEERRRRRGGTLCLFKQTDVSQKWLCVCVCVWDRERKCVCFAIGRRREQVQRLTYRHSLIPSSISQTPTTTSLSPSLSLSPCVSLSLSLSLSLCHRPRQDTPPGSDSHRFKVELLKTFSTRF